MLSQIFKTIGAKLKELEHFEKKEFINVFIYSCLHKSERFFLLRESGELYLILFIRI